MAIDYKKELESAAKSMILVHEPNLLMKMIVRMIVQKVQVKHAGILLHQDNSNNYVLTVSRGPLGVKIPSGFARMDINNPLIKFFKEQKDRLIFKTGTFIFEEARRMLEHSDSFPIAYKEALEKVLHQLEMYDISVCIPSYFRDELLGLLLLGQKRDNSQFDREELDFFTALASDVAMAIRNARLFKELQDELDKRQKLFINTTIAMAAAIEAKDRYTHGHTERVTHISLEIAKILKKEFVNINAKFLEDLRIAALLHDIGKIGVAENILNKDGNLTQEEWEKMKTHPVIGANILQPITELEYAILGVKYHHERYDGKGYPDGLSAGSIPMNAAIICVADSYDAMTTDRPYRKAKPKEEALAEIQRLSGQQFHPQVVTAFIQLFQEGNI